jgi:glycosyltransferase involved in cell wall biosynthesis
VIFIGNEKRYEHIKYYYDRALVSVVPGYVGLQVIQSFSFGVPIVYSDNERHAPEIAAVKNNLNAVSFETDNIKDLSDKIIYSISERHELQSGDEICKMVKELYSIEYMVKIFSEVINESFDHSI